MLKISRKNDATPEKVTLSGVASVYVRVATTLDYNVAMAGAARIGEAIRKGEEALEEAGFDNPELLSDAAVRSGLSEYLFTVEIGLRCVTSWDGIGDVDGHPIAPDRDSIMALVRDPAVARKILNAALRPIHKVIEEGKGSAASPNGAGVVAGNIAPGVKH
jgi:hypothetical protein